MPVMSLGGREREQRPEQLLDMRFEPEIEPRLHRLARRAGEMLVGDDAHARAQHLFAGDELADRGAGPAQRAVGGEHELVVRRLRQPRGARVDLAGERLLRGVLQRLGFGSARRGVGREHEAVEPADGVAFDHDLAGFADLRLELRVLAQPPHQHAGAAVDEALGQPLVQRVGQLVLDAAGDALPMLRIGQPVRPVGDKGPGADMGDAVRERIDIAVGAVGLRHLRGEPVGRDRAVAHEMP